MDDIIWSINPEKDKVKDLLVRMREFAIPLLEGKNISFSFQASVADYQKLSMNLRKNVFLIFKEAIFNIVKHAGASKVQISTAIKNNVFHLSVSDDGNGFNPTTPTQRNGVKNMYKRAESLNGRLSIDSGASGTTLELQCHVK
jgi:signal transduction histidine kinase